MKNVREVYVARPERSGHVHGIYKRPLAGIIQDNVSYAAQIIFTLLIELPRPAAQELVAREVRQFVALSTDADTQCDATGPARCDLSVRLCQHYRRTKIRPDFRAQRPETHM